MSSIPPLSPDAQPAIRMHGVAVTFGAANRPFVAVENVNLDVAPGEFVAIVGPTGCGKSTLLNLVAGLARPSRGGVFVRGAPVVGIAREAGYLFQQDALMPWKTALANVSVALEVQGATPVSAREQAQVWLARVGLARFSERYPHELSGGQRKRVALAQVLIRNPAILLMDEPFGPLDAQTRALMGDLLLSLWQADRKAVLFVTHDLDEAVALADRVVVISAGPAARIVSSHRIDLPRPRATADIRLDPAFHALQREIWDKLRVEVMKAHAEPDPGATP